MTARRSPPRGPDPAAAPPGLALWSFLWGAGCRRLHLSTRGVPIRRDLVVESLAELLAVVEDPRWSGEALDGVDYQLRAGFLERWLRDAVDQPAAAEAARAIRLDDRALKLERWLQHAGRASYFIGSHRVTSVQDLALLPERGGDLLKLAEHIRERVPQERFRTEPAAVRVLDTVRAAVGISDQARALIACLCLGLRRLPLAGRVLEKLDDLEGLLLEPGGREALSGLIESGVLEAWVDALAPGVGPHVAEARGLPPAIAVDRAVRNVLGPAVYPVPGMRARDFGELVQLARARFAELCGDPDARARIRDALFGPMKLPGTPADAEDAPEDALAKLPARNRPNLFAWHALRLPILHVGDATVTSLDEYFAAIATPAGRNAARRLAADRMITQWYRYALGRPLPPQLRDRVAEDDFPCLCIAVGEPPPRVEVSWARTEAAIEEGGAVTFEAVLANHDPVRPAVLALSVAARPDQGRARIQPRLVLPPGARETTRLQYEGAPGATGQIRLVVGISHAGPREAAIAADSLHVTAGFPWRAMLPTVLIWAVLGGAALLFLRLMLHPLASAVLYRDGAIDLTPPSGLAAALVGLGVACLGFIAEHVVIWRRHRRFWPSPDLGPPLLRTRWPSGALVALAAVIWIGRGDELVGLLVLLVMGALVVQLAQRDFIAALLFSGWLAIGRDLGDLILWMLGGLDALALMATAACGISGEPAAAANLGWGLCGIALGLAFGAPLALRAILRPYGAELARLAILALAALLIALRGAP
jgi:hypothetical protein